MPNASLVLCYDAFIQMALGHPKSLHELLTPPFSHLKSIASFSSADLSVSILHSLLDWANSSSSILRYSRSQLDFALYCTRAFPHDPSILRASLGFMTSYLRSPSLSAISELDLSRVLQALNTAISSDTNEIIINALVALVEHRAFLALPRVPILLSLMRKLLRQSGPHRVNHASLARLLNALTREAHASAFSHYSGAFLGELVSAMLQDPNRAATHDLMPSIFSLLSICPKHDLDALLVSLPYDHQILLRKWRDEHLQRRNELT